MLAKLTLQGLDRWTKSGQYEGSFDMWDLLQVPAGASKDTLVNAILYRSFELPVQYMQVERIREQIGLLSDMWQDSMSRTWDALQAEYNPIHNFDRMEDYTDTESGESSNSDSGKSSTSGTTGTTDTGNQTVKFDSQTDGQTTTSNNGTNSNNNTQEQSYMGDTASAYSPASKTTQTGGSTTTDAGTSTSKDTGKSTTTTEDSRTGSGTSASTTEDSRTQSGKNSRTLQHTAHLYGNIGVTTSQQMLEAELALRMSKNWYDLWSNKFVSELCVGIY